MRKLRSKLLSDYLQSTGALQGSEEDIARAKKEYRKQYKREHKKRAQKKLELRPLFTAKEHEQICHRAKLLGLPPTAYAKQVILSAQEDISLVPHRNDLLQILQYISMATIAAHTDTELHQLLFKAEAELLRYLHIQTTI